MQYLEGVQYREYVEDDLAGVIELCVAEGWPSYPEDPARAHRALSAPGADRSGNDFGRSRR